MPLMDADVRPRLWLGNAFLTPAHIDELDNLACVVAGRRRFTLFPPEQVRNLYIGLLDSTPAGAPVSMVSLKAPDFERYPRREALAASRVTELEPGDALFIPAVWWHHVESSTRSTCWSTTGGSRRRPASPPRVADQDDDAACAPEHAPPPAGAPQGLVGAVLALRVRGSVAEAAPTHRGAPGGARQVDARSPGVRRCWPAWRRVPRRIGSCVGAAWILRLAQDDRWVIPPEVAESTFEYKTNASDQLSQAIAKGLHS